MARADCVAKVCSSSIVSGGNCPGCLANHGEATDQVILADERDREQGAVSGPQRGATHSALGGRCQDVRHLDRLLHLREPSGRSLSLSDRRGEHRLDDLGVKLLGGAWHEHLALARRTRR